MYETGTSEWEMSHLTDDDLIKCFVGKFEEMVRKEKEEKGKKIKYIFKVNVLDFNTNEVINDSFFFDLDSLYEWLANVAVHCMDVNMTPMEKRFYEKQAIQLYDIIGRDQIGLFIISIGLLMIVGMVKK